nr:uncharacterized protein LOC123758475 [Procambarus clarkii]
MQLEEQVRREYPRSEVKGHPPSTPHDPPPLLDLDALQVALSRLDHAPQKGKAFIGRSGALSHRRPPSRSSRGSRRSSADSLHLVVDQQALEADLVIPRVVNVEVQLESDGHKDCQREKRLNCENIARNLRVYSQSFREELTDTLKANHTQHTNKEEKKKSSGLDAKHEIRRKLFENRYRRSGTSVGGSNPLLNNSSSEAEESFRRIKEEVARLAAKRRSSSDISDSRTSSDYSYSYNSAQEDQKNDARQWSEERDSVFDSASVALEKSPEENRSSSEAEVVISDRESIADSGLVNRRTVITINGKKSKSASCLTQGNSTPLWIRDLQTRRSLRETEPTQSRLVPVQIDTEFEGGINVCIVSQAEQNRKDSTSRMYVRQSDSENRPSRASAFNVRRTIEKRQIQQERRERRALREKVREQLRSLSESRERRDSSGSHGSSVHLSQNSVRSKSMSSLDQDQDDFRSESPLFKVQSSPTLEKEKEEVRSYLFGGSNLTESEDCCPDMSPACRGETQLIRSNAAECDKLHQVQEKHKTYYIERPETWQWTQSWDSLKTDQEDINESNCRKVSKSVDSVKAPSDISSRHSGQSSIFEQDSSNTSWQEYKCRHTKQGTRLLSSVLNNHPDSLESTKSCPPDALTPGLTTATERDTLPLVPEQLSSSTQPIPPPRRNRLSLSAGQITLEEEDKPNWIRLAKERRSLRTARQVDQLSDRASTASKEPEWVARARKKLELLNVTLTSTTDFNCDSSCVTESSSAWSRGGLDALDDLREEASRIGEELAEEAIARVNEDLGLHKDSSRMLEHNTERSREPSAERPRVSFETSSEASEGDSNRKMRIRKPQKDEVRFGDLKHDWGGAQTKASKISNGKQKEMRFGEIQVKETLPDPSEKTKEMRFGDYVTTTSSQKTQNNPSSPNGSRPVMRFGDTPLNLFPMSEPKGPKSSSKFESIAGPDPTKMTAEQLNQNVEEYDFPIPTGKEDASELMRFLEESLKRTEVVPEVVSLEDHRPKPKSILKRRSVENVLHELKKEERSEGLQKVEHRKSASFDWDSVGKGADAGLDIGHIRNTGHRLSREHPKPHTDMPHVVKPQPQHFHSQHTTPTTTATTATNGSSFFNVKLRHVSSNKRDLAVTNDMLRFHSEHSLHRRPQGSHFNTERHSGDFTSLNTFTSTREIRLQQPRRISTGGDSHGSSSASSQESLSDSLGNLGNTEGDRAISEVLDDLHHCCENKMTLRKLSTTGASREDEGDYSNNRGNNTTDKNDENRHEFVPRSTTTVTTSNSRKSATVGSKSVRELLQRVQEPSSTSWGTCRSGRGLTTSEPSDDTILLDDSLPLVVTGTVAAPTATVAAATGVEVGDNTFSKTRSSASPQHTCSTAVTLNHHPPHHLCDSLAVCSLRNIHHPQDQITSIILPNNRSVINHANLSGGNESTNGRWHEPHSDEESQKFNSGKKSQELPRKSEELVKEGTEKGRSEDEEEDTTQDEDIVTLESTLTNPLNTHRGTTQYPTLATHPAYHASYLLSPVVVQSLTLTEEKQQHPNSPTLITTTAAPPSPPPAPASSTTSPSAQQDIRRNDSSSSTSSQNRDVEDVSRSGNTTLISHHQEGRSLLPSHFQDSLTQFPSHQQENYNALTPHQQENNATFSSHQQESHTTFSSHQQESHTTFSSHQQEIHAPFNVHQGSHVPFPSHTKKEGTRNSPAKVFSFTFSADQKTRPETSFTELEEDSLIRQKTQKEAENTRRTEGMTTFTIITNPNDIHKHNAPCERASLNGHAITPMVSRVQLNKSKSNKINIQNDRSNEQTSKINDYPIRPLRMKLVTQSLASEGERRKCEDKSAEGTSKHRAHQVTVEVVNDEDQRKSLKKKEEKRRSSLLEWEALQRQRLEDEEKNRINKNLSMKPVSVKIKELVKMHGSFMSMFSKDKKTDINGTVDGKDDIVFRKVPSENLHLEQENESIKDIAVPMKSPYIVKKLLSPTKSTSSYEESQRTSRRDSSKSHSPTHRVSSASRRDNSKSRSSSEVKEHTSPRILTESNWKTSATNRATSTSASSSPQKLRLSSSPSRRKASHMPSSPDKSDNKEKDTQLKYGDTYSAESRASDIKQRSRDTNDSSKSSKKVSPPIPPKPLNLHEKSQAYPSPYLEMKRESAIHEEDNEKNISQMPSCYEKCVNEGRSSIKDPKNRKEWLNKMLNSITSDHTLAQDIRDPSEIPTPLLNPSKLCTSTNICYDSVYPEDDRGGKLQDLKSPVPPARKNSKTMLYSTPKYPPCSNTPSPLLSSSSISVTPIKLAISSKLFSQTFTKAPDNFNMTCSSKSNASYPSTPTSMRSSVREALQSDQSYAINGRRGPVSLSSILGDGSSRSSSVTSTPLASPRASPERVIKRDSLELPSKLDVILEPSCRDVQTASLPGEEQKENIAPSPSTKRIKEYKEQDYEEKEEEDCSSTPLTSPYRSSLTFKNRSGERSKGFNDEEMNPRKETKNSWHTSVHKPFNLIKPSVTLKTMTSGIDPKRVATSIPSPSHRDDSLQTTYLMTCKISSLHDNSNKRYLPDKSKPTLDKSECSENTEPSTSRISHERPSLTVRLPELSPKVATVMSSSLGTSEGRRVSSQMYEPYLSRNSRETSSLRSREPSERSTPDRDSRPVSLSSILSKDRGSKDSIVEELSNNFQFSPELSFSEELNNITHKYCKDMAVQRSSSETTVIDTSGNKLALISHYDSDDVFDNDSTTDRGDKTRETSLEPESKESSPIREIKGGKSIKNKKEKLPERRKSREASSNLSAPKGLPKTSTNPSKSKNRIVHRNSSLKRNRPEDPGGSLRNKKDRKVSRDDSADLKDETIVQNDAGWTKTKTTVRRARLGSTEKARQIVRTNSGKTRKEKTFKANASKALEDWAAGTTVQGKLMKKEGQKFSHETEEEVKGGQRSSKSVTRRVVRRGSRRMSGGGELLTQTKETSSTGATKDEIGASRGGRRQEKKGERQVKQQNGPGSGAVVSVLDNGLSRRMKTSTDGERYMTQSVSDKDGKTTYTTEGVNNKTTNSLEVIGGEDFNAKREVQGRTGHRVVVERTKDSQGRPSTVVKKITSQSRVVITKTKRKSPSVV